MSVLLSSFSLGKNALIFFISFSLLRLNAQGERVRARSNKVSEFRSGGIPQIRERARRNMHACACMSQ